MFVKFTKNATYKQADPSQSKEYLAGEVHCLEDDHAQRWIRRNVAVEVPPEPPKKPEPKPKHEKPEK